MNALTAAVAVLALVAVPASRTAMRRQTDPRDEAVILHARNTDIRSALRQVFGGMGVSYSVSPAVQGTVTIDLDGESFETALRQVLDKVDATFRVDGGIYQIIPRSGDCGEVAPWTPLPEFRPGRYTSSYEVRNSALFLSPHRTFGGSCDLLAEASAIAGLGAPSVYRYGNDGLAFVLRLEKNRSDGAPERPRLRFAYQIDTAAIDFRKVADSVQFQSSLSSSRLRLFVLVVSPDPIKAEGVVATGRMGRPAGTTDLPQETRLSKWAKKPKLTVLIYEFRINKGSGKSVLLKKGESGVTARKHLISAGLWNAKQLDLRD